MRAKTFATKGSATYQIATLTQAKNTSLRTRRSSTWSASGRAGQKVLRAGRLRGAVSRAGSAGPDR